MEYKLTIIGVDCGNCAQKIEEKVRNIEGVKSFTFNFLTEKAKLETEENIKDLANKILKVAKKIERGVKLEVLNE